MMAGVGGTGGLRRDHNIVVRVVEARQLPADCQDTYCIVRIDNRTAEQVREPTCTHSLSHTRGVRLKMASGVTAAHAHGMAQQPAAVGRRV
jgi:hypothetical protein